MVTIIKKKTNEQIGSNDRKTFPTSGEIDPAAYISFNFLNLIGCGT
jgi:hypothetical protein